MDCRAIVVLLAVVSVSGCGDGDGPPTQVWFGGERAVELMVPVSYDHAEPTPLVIVLHGYGVTARIQLAYSQLGDLVEDAGVLMLAPEGTDDEEGSLFWNATDACCDFYGVGVDDVAYVGGLIDEVKSVYNVDPARVYLFGHSNGGFMSYRMACERAGDIAAIVSLAGATFDDPAACDPAEPVSVLQIHGDGDDSVDYEGGDNCTDRECLYPGAAASLDAWAEYDGCGAGRSQDPGRLDLDRNLAGEETRVERQDGCPDGIGLELWTIEGGGHIPAVQSAFPGLVWGWLSAHSKP